MAWVSVRGNVKLGLGQISQPSCFGSVESGPFGVTAHRRFGVDANESTTLRRGRFKRNRSSGKRFPFAGLFGFERLLRRSGGLERPLASAGGAVR